MATIALKTSLQAYMLHSVVLTATVLTQAASPTNLAQLQEIGVKVAGGFGPIAWEPAQLSWVMANPAAALESISRNMSEAIIKDQLNTAIHAAVAAIEAQSTPQG